MSIVPPVVGSGLRLIGAEKKGRRILFNHRDEEDLSLEWDSMSAHRSLLVYGRARGPIIPVSSKALGNLWATKFWTDPPSVGEPKLILYLDDSVSLSFKVNHRSGVRSVGWRILPITGTPGVDADGSSPRICAPVLVRTHEAPDF